MAWFNEHLNWTLVFALIPANVLTLLVPAANRGQFVAPIIGAVILILVVEVWFLRQKEQSLLWSFAGPIGLIVLLALGNKVSRRRFHA